MFKKCTKCEKEKPLADFYQHKGMKDGHLSVCKGCTKARVHTHRAMNIERIREYDRQRGLLPHRKKAVRSRAHRYVGKYKTYKELHPERRAAHVAVGNAISAGLLKAKPCERCYYAVGVHAHHEDYSKPLEVIWLCKKCHGQRHREINEERRRRAA